MDLALLRKEQITDSEWQSLMDQMVLLGNVQRGEGRTFVFGDRRCTVPKIAVSSSPVWAEPGDDFSALGWTPYDEVVVSTDSEGRADHLAIGRFALALMRRLPALADFGGLIGPEPLVHADSSEEFSAHAARVRPFMGSFPGQFYEVRYSINLGEDYRVSHVVDLEFLEAWLAHSACHLITEWQS